MKQLNNYEKLNIYLLYTLKCILFIQISLNTYQNTIKIIKFAILENADSQLLNAESKKI